ncbi:MAG: hypothetical protein MSR67_00115 [Oscillospiraceae bacterium]|nr:hypothetical protein [Oscillospiraceae bacterium]
MSTLQKEIDSMLELLPDSEQKLAYEFIKRLVLAWDSDYTKVTPKEREQLEEAEESGFVPENEIDWDNLSKYSE